MTGQSPVLTFRPDPYNQGLPLAIVVTWDSNIDLENKGHEYDMVTNQFLIKDDGKLVLAPLFFKDVPKEAKGIMISLWRGNAAVDPQNFYFLVSTYTYFPVELTD